MCKTRMKIWKGIDTSQDAGTENFNREKILKPLAISFDNQAGYSEKLRLLERGPF